MVRRKKNKNSIKIVTIENQNDIISPNPTWNSLSLEERISLSNFHENLIFEILLRIPPTSLHELRRVCKEWLHIITDPYFIQSHLHRLQLQPHIIQKFTNFNGETSSLDVKDSEMNVHSLNIGCVGDILVSCNGLLLVRYKSDIHISNPVTKKLLKLPTCSTFSDYYRRFEFWDLEFFRFGHAPSTMEYKVLHFFPHQKQQHCEILTLGSNEWRRVAGQFRNLPLKINEQVMLNGVLHWVVGYEYIVSMNVAEETFYDTPFPSCVAPPYHKSRIHQTFYLMEMGGYPSLMVRISEAKFDVWILKDFKRKEWMRLFSIDGAEVGGFLIPITGLRNDEVILIREKRWSLFLCTYNLRLQKMVDVRMYPEMFLIVFDMIHFHSLVSWKIHSQSG